MTQPTVPASVTFGLVTEWHFGNEVVHLLLDVENKPATQSPRRSPTRRGATPNRANELGRGDRGVTVISGHMAEGQRLPIIALLKEYIPELDPPDSIKDLAISKLNVQIRPQYGSYFFECGISNVWAIQLDSGVTLAIRQLDFLLETVKEETPQDSNGQSPQASTPVALSQQRRFAFAGLFELFGGTFRVVVEHRFSQTSLADLNAQRRPNQLPSSSSPRRGANTTRSSTVAIAPQDMWSYWSFTAEAQNIDLAGFIAEFTEPDTKLPEGLNLPVTLRFAYTQARKNRPSSTSASSTETETEYRFYADLDWNTGLSLVEGGDPLKVRATVEVAKKTLLTGSDLDKQVTGKVTGIVNVGVPLFESLQIEVSYFFTKQQNQPQNQPKPAIAQKSKSELEFKIILGKLFLLGSYYETSELGTAAPQGARGQVQASRERWLILSAGFLDPTTHQEGNFTFGDILASVISLFDPNFDDFELDPPWDKLGKKSIALDAFQFRINLTTKTFSVSYNDTLDLILFKVSNLSITYAGATQAKSGIRISLDLSIAGQAPQTTSWDPINENPPAVPGETPPIFDLQFLAVGQRVSFAPEIVREARNITQVMNVMRQTLIPLPPAQRRQNPITALQAALPPAPVSVDPTAPITYSGEPIIFSANSGILIGAQFSVMGTLDMSIIFNDPLIYGLRIALYGEKAQIFAGLEFEILYRRISDTVGVYHVELALPTAMRQLEFGAVSVTLPVVAVDVYTNGDFGIDFGFPWQGNFERSFAIQAFPFIGAGGFYFYKLSAETATSTPKITNGNFDPVLEFGIGLKIGLGKSFDKGVLKAELSISVHGIIQGVIAWFNPSDPALSSDPYYKIQGGVSIVGRLYGVVDFAVITVEVEVIIRITVLFVVEAYQPIFLAVEAQVSVRASIKIVFVRIHFSFNLVVRADFTLGSASPTPWRLAAPKGSGAMPALGSSRQPKFAAPMYRTKVPMPRQGAAAHPAASRRTPSAVPPNPHPGFRSGDGADGSGSASMPMDGWEQVRAASALEGLVPAGVRSLSWSSIALEFPSFGIAATPSATTQAAEGIVLPGSPRSVRQIDLYFQVALTRGASAPEGVAMLLIENFVPLDQDRPAAIESQPHSKDTDFDVLVKSLLAWAVYTYSPQSSIPDPSTVQLSLDSLEDLYQSVINYFGNPATTSDFLTALYGFLGQNFSFNITDRSTDGKDRSGSVFPMIPTLAMQVGDQTVEFDGTARRRSPDNLEMVRRYARQLLVSHGSTVELPPPSATGAYPALTVAEFIFADYFALLIRLALQSAIDHVEQRMAATPNATRINYTISLPDLLVGLNGVNSFKHLAGTTSRFFLHGLRIPGAAALSADDLATVSTEGLYQATGQQFNPLAETALRSIVLQDRANLPWINFTDYVPATEETPAQQNSSATALNYDYSGYQPSALGFITQLNQVAIALITEKVHRSALVDFYSDARQRYSLRHRSHWQRDGATAMTPVLEVPTDLQSLLQQHPSGIDLRLQVNANAQAGQPVTADRQLEGTWLTKVRLTVRQVSQAEDQTPVPQTYLMVGTDEPGKALLDAILDTNATPTIDLLYAGSGNTGSDRDGRLASQSTATVLLLKTNLALPSTLGSYTTRPRGEGADPRAFLQRVLESSSLEDGGYHLYYANGTDGLPDSIFTQGNEGTLVLLIRVTGMSDRAYPFHNCVALKPEAAQDLETDDIYVDSPITVKALSIPAGNLGFRVERDAIPLSLRKNQADDEADDEVSDEADNRADDEADNQANDELENLYQLLSYRLRDSETVRASADGLPLGPAADDPNTSLDDDLWIYERVVPVYALAKADAAAIPSRDATLLRPPAPANPYRGIRPSARVTLDFHWQDLYGNRLQEKPSFTDTFAVRYFDELLGINQWPSVTESFTFTAQPGEAGGVDLNLELVLDPSNYQSGSGTVEAEIQKTIRSDRALYETLHYQIHQADLTFTAQTSLLWKFHPVAQGDTLQSVATAFQVPVESLGIPNQAVLNLFATDTKLQIPLVGKPQPTTTLKAIARSWLQMAFLLASHRSLAELTAHLNTPNPLPSSDDATLSRLVGLLVTAVQSLPHLLKQGYGVAVVLPPAAEGQPAPDPQTYTVKYGDTFAEVARDTNRSLADLATLLQDDPNALAPHITWPLIIRYTVQDGDSLEAIRQKVELVAQHDLYRASPFALSAHQLTVAALVKQNQTKDLNPQMRSPAEDHRTPPLYIPDRIAITHPRFLIDFVERAYHYLKTLENLVPLTVTTRPADNLEGMGDRYLTPVGDLADTNQAVPNLFPTTASIEIPVEWDVAEAHSLHTIATGLCQAETLMAIGTGVRAIAALPDSPLPPADAARSAAKVQDLIQRYQDIPNLLVEKTVIPAKAGSTASAYSVNLGDTLKAAATAAGYALETRQDVATLAAAIQSITGLLDAKLVLTLPLVYQPQANDSLESILQKVRQVAAHSYIAIQADSLTVALIGEQNATVNLSSGIALEIPHRLEFPQIPDGAAQGGTVVVGRSLGAVATELSAGDRPDVTPADVAIANQNIHGLLNPEANLLPPSSPYTGLITLLQTVADPTTSAAFPDVLAFLQTPRPRQNETLGTLQARFERLVAFLNANLEGLNRWLQTRQTTVAEALEQVNSPTGVVPPEIYMELAQVLALLRQVNTPALALGTTLNHDIQRLIPRLDQDSLSLTSSLLQDAQAALTTLQRVQQSLRARLGQRFTVAQFAEAIAPIPSLLIPKARVVLPPVTATTTLDLGPVSAQRYPRELLTPVTVQVEIRRQESLIHDSVKDMATVQAATAFLSPKVAPITAAEADQTASLRQFATLFQAAFPAYRLATSGDRTSSPTPPGQPATQSIWAVKLGQDGLTYNIHESLPFFFTAAPLSNVLISGQVRLYPYSRNTGLRRPDSSPEPATAEAVRFEAVDLNVLARQFLQAVEDFLKPESAMAASTLPALQAQGHVQTLLAYKERLAIAISDQVTHILNLTSADPNLARLRDQRQSIAKAALQRELRVNLADAYDIETILQYSVEVSIHDGQPWRRQTAQTVTPRLAGQPINLGADASASLPDFTLSPAKIPLATRGSNLTFFFNTKTPDQFEGDFELTLAYKANDLEFDIDANHPVSSWLTFILPIDGEGPSQDDYRLTPAILDEMVGAGLPTNLRAALAPLVNAPNGGRWTSRTDFMGVLREALGQSNLQTYQWLILTAADSSVPNHIGPVQIPVPLRTFPIAPSLIMQEATADPDSLERLEQVREWQYDYVYEHVNVAQDAIETRVQYNIAEVASANPHPGTFEDPDSESLFDALVRFSQIYPQLELDLDRLRTREVESHETAVGNAIAAFTQLVQSVTQEWERWQEVIGNPEPRPWDFVIEEDHQKHGATVTAREPMSSDRFPTLTLPEFKTLTDTLTPTPDHATSRRYTLEELTDKTAVQFFGESDLPDRKVALPSLDIVTHQNAWAAIWLTRNKTLISGMTTNPAFVFQTPQVRFSDRLVPLLTNSKRWDLATLPTPHSPLPTPHSPLPTPHTPHPTPHTPSPLNRPLLDHLDLLFSTVLPQRSDRPYDIRISCQYAFALVLGDPGLDDDLLSSLPVFLSPRFSVPPTHAPNSDLMTITGQLRENMAKEVQLWQQQKRPVQAMGRYVFSLSLFSNRPTDPDAPTTTDNPNQPLLKVEHLSLALADISEYLRPEQDIARLLSPSQAPQIRTLEAHLQNLLNTLTSSGFGDVNGLPDFDDPSSVRYHIQVVVQYVVSANIPGTHLLRASTPGVAMVREPLLNPSLSLKALGDRLLSPIAAHHQSLAGGPSTGGQYIFSISLLSDGPQGQAPERSPQAEWTRHFYLSPGQMV